MPCRSPKLQSDERGMILVVALPMAALLIGCLWYVISVGDAALHRERLQDAADATAFESAVLHARAMNAEVSLNLVSASLSSVPAVLRALQVVGASAAAMSGEGRPLLELALATDRELSPRVSDVMRVVHETQLALRASAPLIAAAEASRNNSALARELDAADGAVAISYATLAVRDQATLTADARKPWLLVTTAPSTRERVHIRQDGRLPLLPGALGVHCDADQHLVLPPAAAALLHARKLDHQLSELAKKLGAGLTSASCERTACEEGAWAAGVAADAKQRCQAALRELPTLPPGTTLELDPRAQNGNALLQTWSVAKRERFGKEQSDERGMSLATPAAPIDIKPKNAAFAQAEYYFDCADSWELCAANAAWNPRWTARLRRFERPDAGRDPSTAYHVRQAYLRASAGLEHSLQRGGARDARAYMHALFDAPPCGHTSCLH